MANKLSAEAARENKDSSADTRTIANNPLVEVDPANNGPVDLAVVATPSTVRPLTPTRVQTPVS